MIVAASDLRPIIRELLLRYVSLSWPRVKGATSWFYSHCSMLTTMKQFKPLPFQPEGCLHTTPPFPFQDLAHTSRLTHSKILPSPVTVFHNIVPCPQSIYKCSPNAKKFVKENARTAVLEPKALAPEVQYKRKVARLWEESQCQSQSGIMHASLPSSPSQSSY